MSLVRYLGYTIEQVDNLTIREVNILMKAIRLRNVDLDYRSHLDAWLNLSVKGTKGKHKPRPLYQKFSSFFDYEAAIKRANGEEQKENDRFKALSRYLKEKKENV